MANDKCAGPPDPLRVCIVLACNAQRLQSEHRRVGEANTPEGIFQSRSRLAVEEGKSELTKNRTRIRPDAGPDECIE